MDKLGDLDPVAESSRASSNLSPERTATPPPSVYSRVSSPVLHNPHRTRSPPSSFHDEANDLFTIPQIESFKSLRIEESASQRRYDDGEILCMTPSPPHQENYDSVDEDIVPSSQTQLLSPMKPHKHRQHGSIEEQEILDEIVNQDSLRRHTLPEQPPVTPPPSISPVSRSPYHSHNVTPPSSHSSLVPSSQTPESLRISDAIFALPRATHMIDHNSDTPRPAKASQRVAFAETPLADRMSLKTRSSSPLDEYDTLWGVGNPTLAGSQTQAHTVKEEAVRSDNQLLQSTLQDPPSEDQYLSAEDEEGMSNVVDTPSKRRREYRLAPQSLYENATYDDEPAPLDTSNRPSLPLKESSASSGLSTETSATTDGSEGLVNPSRSNSTNTEGGAVTDSSQSVCLLLRSAMWACITTHDDSNLVARRYPCSYSENALKLI